MTAQPESTAELTPIDRLVATAECHKLMLEYAYRMDRAASTVHPLFTEDGEWTSPTIHCTGRDALRVYFTRREEMRERVTRHGLINVDITILDADHATARSVAVEFRDDAPPGELVTDTRPAIIGDYEDTFLRVDGRWLFRRRDVLVAFKRTGEEYIQPVNTGEFRS